MQIVEKVYDDILNRCFVISNETGGILGGKDNIITEFKFDKGTSQSSKQHYYPNIQKLNNCIENWQDRDIQFYGIIHSHLKEERTLSDGDLKYIRTIILSMPTHITFLYFPIVLPQKEIVSFKAMRVKNEVSIINSNIKIINERM